MKTYSTSQIAKMLSVHPNTVRWYEAVGLISPVERLANGYRQFNNRHLVQLKVCRLIYGGGYPNKQIRDSSMKILAYLKEWDIKSSLEQTRKYHRLIEAEYSKALETSTILTNWTEQTETTSNAYTRKEAADLLGITAEVLRNWERNGLINISRTGKKNEKVYGDNEMKRLRVIYMLRQNNYSIAAIHRSLVCFDNGNSAGAALALNQPVTNPDQLYICAGDHWLEVLWKLSLIAKKIIRIIDRVKSKPSNFAPL